MFGFDTQVISEEDYSLRFLNYTSDLILTDNWKTSKDLYSNLFNHGMNIVKKYGKRTPIIYVILKVLKIIRVECARILSGKPELEEQSTNQLFAETEIEVREVSRELIMENISEAVSELKNEVDECRNFIEELGIKAILDDDIILTLGYSELVFSVMKYATKKKRKFTVIILEGYPVKGAAQMADKLAKLGVSVIVASERSSFTLLSKANKVFLESDTVFADGGLLCRSGDHQICLDAQRLAVPVYMCLLSSRLSPLLSVDYTDKSCYPDADNDNLAIYPTDLVPSDLVTSLVTDLGSLHPSEFMSIAKDCFSSDDVRDFLRAVL